MECTECHEVGIKAMVGQPKVKKHPNGQRHMRQPKLQKLKEMMQPRETEAVDIYANRIITN